MNREIEDKVSEDTNEIHTEGSVFNTLQLPEEIYDNLPAILKESAKLFQDDIKKDVFLIGAIVV